MIAGAFRFLLEGLEISIHLVDTPPDTAPRNAREPHGRTEFEGIKMEYSHLVEDPGTEPPRGFLRFRNHLEVPGILTIARKFEIEVAPGHSAVVTARAESKARLET